MPTIQHGLTTRRLVDRTSWNLIRAYNSRTNSPYPKHQEWVDRALKALEVDDYSRMAFGVFLHLSGEAAQLCCSVIVSVSPFTPYLELKNLIIFEDTIQDDWYGREIDNREKFRQDCFVAVIQHVQNFSADRGYQRLITEVLRDHDEYRLLTQCLVQCGFSIIGSQAKRYSESDDVVFLAWNVEGAYGHDPYDYFSASNWVVKRHVPGAELSRELKLKLFIKSQLGESVVEKKLAIFETNNSSDPIARRLSDRLAVLVLEDNFAWNIGLAEIQNFAFEDRFDGRVLVFDYQENHADWVDSLMQMFSKRFHRVTHICRHDLLELLYGKKTNASNLHQLENLVPFAKIGGLLTLSDPVRFKFDVVENIFNGDLLPIYVKLGPKGKFLGGSYQYLVLSYFDPKNADAKQEIWGIGKIESIMFVDLNKGGSEPQSTNTGERLYSIFASAEEDARPIWDVDEFVKHNHYNASNMVVCVYLESIIDLRDQRMTLTVLGVDPKREDFLIRQSDAYLSMDEVDALFDEVEKNHKNARRITRKSNASGSINTGAQFNQRIDFALSFAAQDRKYAEKLAMALESRGARVYYDKNERSDLVGKDLYQHFQTVYKYDSKFFVAFLSQYYVLNNWTQHELRQAQARAFQQTEEYILPLKMDDANVPGINETTGYLDARTTSIEEIAIILFKKLKKSS